MGNFRWTPEALAAFDKRALEWRKTGTVREHLCKDDKNWAPAERKYRNKPTVVAEVKFASKKEARRWKALQVLQAAKAITDLDRQVAFSLDINGQHICTYIADFVYRDKSQQFIEDCKGYKTEVYKLKKTLMKAIHGIDVFET